MSYSNQGFVVSGRGSHDANLCSRALHMAQHTWLHYGAHLPSSSLLSLLLEKLDEEPTELIKLQQLPWDNKIYLVLRTYHPLKLGILTQRNVLLCQKHPQYLLLASNSSLCFQVFLIAEHSPSTTIFSFLYQASILTVSQRSSYIIWGQKNSSSAYLQKPQSWDFALGIQRAASRCSRVCSDGAAPWLYEHRVHCLSCKNHSKRVLPSAEEPRIVFLEQVWSKVFTLFRQDIHNVLI